jgi:hypothetical protein
MSDHYQPPRRRKGDAAALATLTQAERIFVVAFRALFPRFDVEASYLAKSYEAAKSGAKRAAEVRP